VLLTKKLKEALNLRGLAKRIRGLSTPSFNTFLPMRGVKWTNARGTNAP
jgi:hypothetical protein